MVTTLYFLKMAFPAFYLVLFSVAGLIAGSFMTVVVARLPAVILNERFDEWWLCMPRSHCPQCKTVLGWQDNIPLFSWVGAGGQCRHCGEDIPLLYPLLEVGCAILFLSIAVVYSEPMTAMGLSLMCWFLLALAVIDYRHFLLPDCLTLTLLWSGLLFTAFQTPDLLVDSVAGAVAGYGVFYALNRFWLLFRKTNGLGLGDAKLLAALGAWVGWEPLPAICLLSALLGIALYVYRRSTGEVMAYIPFGMPLALGGGVMVMKEFLQWQ